MALTLNWPRMGEWKEEGDAQKGRSGIGGELGNLTKGSDGAGDFQEKEKKKGTHTSRLHPQILLWVLPSEDCGAL